MDLFRWYRVTKVLKSVEVEETKVSIFWQLLMLGDEHIEFKINFFLSSYFVRQSKKKMEQKLSQKSALYLCLIC